MVIGERRKYAAALLTLDPDGVRGASASRRPISAGDRDDRHAARAGGRRGEHRRSRPYETIKKFMVLPTEFTIESRRADADA